MAKNADVDIQPIARADFVPAKVFRSRSMNTPAGNLKIALPEKIALLLHPRHVDVPWSLVVLRNLTLDDKCCLR